jgi:hypothetical protein
MMFRPLARDLTFFASARTLLHAVLRYFPYATPLSKVVKRAVPFRLSVIKWPTLLEAHGLR